MILYLLPVAHDVTLGFFFSFVHPDFLLQETLDCSERQEDVKKHVL